VSIRSKHVTAVRAAITLVMLALGARAQTVIEIIDPTGDGLGNTVGGAESLTVDAEGSVYVACWTTDNAFKIGPQGSVTEIIDVTGDGAGNGLTSCSGIAIDGAGNVYVTGVVSDNAFKITPTGVITEIIDGTGDGAGNPLDAPYRIAVDVSGVVYVSGSRSDNAFRITPGGVITEIIDATGEGGVNVFDTARGIAVDGAGNVYVAGWATSNVFRITPGGLITEIIDGTGDGSGNPLNVPHDVAVLPSGIAYVAGLGSDNVFEITPGGTVKEIIDGTGDGSSPLNGPHGVAVDTLGNVYVTGFLSNTAFKITPAGDVKRVLDGTGDGLGNTLDNPHGIHAGVRGVLVSGWSSGNVFAATGGPLGFPSFCDAADGSLASCPCSNPGQLDSGCDLKQSTGGIHLDVSRQVTGPLNRATLVGSGFPPANAPDLVVIRSPALNATPIVFGDGLRCIGSPVVRVGATGASGGTSSQRIGHGAMIGSGTFFYQLWARNMPIGFCDPAAAFNLSNGRSLTW